MITALGAEASNAKLTKQSNTKDGALNFLRELMNGHRYRSDAPSLLLFIPCRITWGMDKHSAIEERDDNMSTHLPATFSFGVG